MLTRRFFIKGFASSAAAGPSVVGVALASVFSFFTRKKSPLELALETKEGRRQLAEAMCEPINKSLEYQAIGRKLLMVDELPQGALERYEEDVNAAAKSAGIKNVKFKALFDYERQTKGYGFCAGDG